MPRVSLDPAAPRFLVDGEPEFLLADTIWSAFCRPTAQEWRSYLRLRRRQGFNALNINILSIPHDRSTSVFAEERSPYLRREDNSWDLDRPDPAYFANARAMCELAIAHGMTPILIVLWCNYVPGTWGAALTPELVLTEEQTDAHVDRVVETFADLGVIFAASGDENFSDPRSVERYERVLRRLRRKAPDTLLTLHPAPFVTQPPALTELIDFYGYQTGHDDDWSTQPAVDGARFRALPARKPLVSMEPPYEGHGYGKGAGRHTAFDVRLASWISVLAGSGAGLGYGAHGVWSWHRQGEPFNGEHFSGTPFPADVALRFDGAWDMGLLRRLVEEHGLHDLRLRQELLVDDPSGAHVGVGDDRVVVYLPHPFAVTLDLDLSGWDVRCWNLGARNTDHAVPRFADGRTIVEQPEFLSDALLIFSRR